MGSIPGTPPACAFQQCLAVCCFVNFWICFHGKVSEVAEDSLLGGSKNEAAVSTAQDGTEGAAGVWYVSDASY